MFYTIYKITDKSNGKIYIGKHQTQDLNDNYMGSGKRIRRAIAKRGLDSFTKEILFVFETEDEMNAKEAELVTEEFCLHEDTYNLCPGGKGGFGYVNSNGLNRGQWHSDNIDTHMKYISDLGNSKKRVMWQQDVEWASEYSQKLSDMAKKHSDLYGGSFKGKSHTEATKQKMSNSKKGRNNKSDNSQYGTMWIYSLFLKESKKINKNDPIPDGWCKGRKIKF